MKIENKFYSILFYNLIIHIIDSLYHIYVYLEDAQMTLYRYFRGQGRLSNFLKRGRETEK